jgi:hypothetical protein
MTKARTWKRGRKRWGGRLRDDESEASARARARAKVWGELKQCTVGSQKLSCIERKLGIYTGRERNEWSKINISTIGGRN